VWYWIPVRDGVRFDGSVVSTGPPTLVLLWHEMEGGRPWAFGASGGDFPQHDVRHGLDDGHTVWCQVAWAAGYGWAGCCVNVLCCVVPNYAVVPCWLGQPREFLQEAVCWCCSSDDFNTGD